MHLAGKHGMVELSPDTLRALQLRYPLCNVTDQLTLYAYWLEKNPSRRPVRALRGVENWLKKCSPKAPLVDVNAAKWWTNETATLEMARRVGIAPKPGEEWSRLRARIREKLAA